MCHWREAGGRWRSSEEVAPCVRGGGARPGRLARAAVGAVWGCWLVPIARPCSHVVDVAVALVHLTLEFVHDQFLGRGELCGGHIGRWRGAFLGRVEGCLCSGEAIQSHTLMQKGNSRRAEERRKRGQSDAEQLEVARLVLARHGRKHWPLVVVTGSA